VNYLIRNCGWRHSFEILGVVIMLVLIPVGIGVTRSTPADLGLLPDGADHAVVATNNGPVTAGAFEVKSAIRSRNFWLILAGSTLVVGAIGAVTHHFIFVRASLWDIPLASGVRHGSQGEFLTHCTVTSWRGTLLPWRDW
jgi:hypothetical protein